jgi:hypothetical protein
MAKRGRVYIFEPFGFDLFDPKAYQPERGARVVKTQPHGAPKNGTMGFVYVQDAESGKFYGLVRKASLVATGDTAVVRDLAAEARDARSAAIRAGLR